MVFKKGRKFENTDSWNIYRSNSFNPQSPSLVWLKFIIQHLNNLKYSLHAFASKVSWQHFVWVNKISSTVQEFVLLVLTPLSPWRVVKLDVSARTVPGYAGVCVSQQLSQTGVFFVYSRKLSIPDKENNYEWWRKNNTLNNEKMNLSPRTL